MYQIKKWEDKKKSGKQSKQSNQTHVRASLQKIQLGRCMERTQI